MMELTTDQDALLRELEEIHDGYKSDVKQFVNFIRERKLFLAESLREYAAWLAEEHDGRRYSQATINRKISAAKNRIRYAFRHGSFADSLHSTEQLEEFLAEVKIQRIDPVPVTGDRTLSLDEAKLLVRETKDKTISLMVRFLAGTGVRITEMLAIRLADLGPEKENIVDIRVLGKREKERRVHVNADFVKKIHAHFKGTEFLFEHDGRSFNRVSVTNRIKHESLRFLGREISAQQLRYTWAREQISRGKSVRAVAAVLGYVDSGQTVKPLTEDALIPEESFLDVAAFDEEAEGTRR